MYSTLFSLVVVIARLPKKAIASHLVTFIRLAIDAIFEIRSITVPLVNRQSML